MVLYDVWYATTITIRTTKYPQSTFKKTIGIQKKFSRRKTWFTWSNKLIVTIKHQIFDLMCM